MLRRGHALCTYYTSPYKVLVDTGGRGYFKTLTNALEVKYGKICDWKTIHLSYGQ